MTRLLSKLTFKSCICCLVFFIISNNYAMGGDRLGNYSANTSIQDNNCNQYSDGNMYPVIGLCSLIAMLVKINLYFIIRMRRE